MFLSMEDKENSTSRIARWMRGTPEIEDWVSGPGSMVFGVVIVVVVLVIVANVVFA